MSTFDEREKAFENKFKHDEELRFRVTVRRNKLFGLWAAKQLGLSDTEAQAYALTVVDADFQEPGDADVIRKVVTDLEAKGVNLSEHRVQKELQNAFEQARQEIMSA